VSQQPPRLRCRRSRRRSIARFAIWGEAEAERAVIVGDEGAIPRIGIPEIPEIYSRRQKLSVQQLKGIGSPYAIHKFFCPRSLNGLYVQMAADKQNRIKHLEYEATAKVLPTETVAKLAQSLAGFTPAFSAEELDA